MQAGIAPSLRFVRSSAAAMPPADVAMLTDLLGVPFVNSYGMTETGGGVISTLPGLPYPPGSPGVAISPGLEIIILNDDGVEVPLGQTGEVCVK